MKKLVSVKIILRDCDGEGYAEFFGNGFYLGKEPVYIDSVQAEALTEIIKRDAPGSIITLEEEKQHFTW